jgi:hypothetical protein
MPGFYACIYRNSTSRYLYDEHGRLRPAKKPWRTW